VTIVADKEDKTISNLLTFKGTYAPVSISEAGDNTLLYLGADNKLYYPSSAMEIGVFRAYFQLDGITAGDAIDGVRQFVLNFSDETTDIILNTNDTNLTKHNVWYTLDGRKLSGKPTSRGIYINNGHKVTIK
ncbi:hypothetical protein RCJ22_03465, partial [Vibrio sp. FNV 38]|nr:hypothetical protein [Vibrio sp. FNV 38]